MSRFPAESSLVTDVVPSPNHGERRAGCTIDMILLHYTGMPDANAALEKLCSPQSELSAHYVVFEDSRIVQCVPEGRRAWHAGVSSWAGETDVNSCSIGVEIANPGHDNGYPDYPRRQIAAVIALCRGIIARRGIPADRVLGHSDVAPGRKRDPGERFPWQLLHESGVGHWVKPAPMVEGLRLSAGDRGEAVGVLQSQLRQYGYGLDVTGLYDDATGAVVTAFQRHFRPALCDGVADESTLATLRALLATRSQPSTSESAAV
jgi:N-acetylmuramoyl-L-alanine amidase